MQRCPPIGLHPSDSSIHRMLKWVYATATMQRRVLFHRLLSSPFISKRPCPFVSHRQIPPSSSPFPALNLASLKPASEGPIAAT